jgi:hypothetical protein
MSKSAVEAKACINDCVVMIYFDRDSKESHPSADKWIPLEIKEGRSTDRPHIVLRRMVTIIILCQQQRPY